MNTLTQTTTQDIKAIFEKQMTYRQEVSQSTTSERIAKLKKLKKAIMNHRDEIKEALFKDYKKHPSEVDLTEIYPVTGDLKHTISHLRKWMSKKTNFGVFSAIKSTAAAIESTLPNKETLGQ